MPPARIASANSMVEVARASAQTSGPALGGLLVHLLTAPVAVVVDAVSYLASAALLRGLPELRLDGLSPFRGSLWRGVATGVGFCLRLAPRTDPEPWLVAGAAAPLVAVPLLGSRPMRVTAMPQRGEEEPICTPA